MSSGASPIIISKSGGGGIIHRGHRIPGILPSVRYGEQVVSTGIPSLDSFIGGGIPLGSICIIKDSFPSRYSNCILKTFIAEGATYNHHIYIACGLGKSESLINELPCNISSKKSEDTGDHSSISGDSENLKIAWRYGHQNSPSGITSSKEITKFEFSKKTTASDLGAKNVIVSQLFESCNNTLNHIHYSEFLKEIAQHVKAFEIPRVISKANSKPPSNLLRICLSHCEEQVLSPGFMSGLRALVRHTNSCALITVSNVAGSTDKIYRVQHLADYVIALQAVADEKRRTDLGDIDGICDVIKISSINSLKPVEPPRDLGFSFKKKRLLFHELHLPPEGEDTTQREVSRPITSTSSNSSGCGVTIKGKSIDF